MLVVTAHISVVLLTSIEGTFVITSDKTYK